MLVNKSTRQSKQIWVIDQSWRNCGFILSCLFVNRDPIKALKPAKRLTTRHSIGFSSKNLAHYIFKHPASYVHVHLKKKLLKINVPFKLAIPKGTKKLYKSLSIKYTIYGIFKYLQALCICFFKLAIIIIIINKHQVFKP